MAKRVPLKWNKNTLMMVGAGVVLVGAIYVLYNQYSGVSEGFQGQPPAECKEEGSPVFDKGQLFRKYTKAQCDKLGGNYSKFSWRSRDVGECLKKSGGSFSWDCRGVNAKDCSGKAKDLVKRAISDYARSLKFLFPGNKDIDAWENRMKSAIDDPKNCAKVLQFVYQYPDPQSPQSRGHMLGLLTSPVGFILGPSQRPRPVKFGKDGRCLTSDQTTKISSYIDELSGIISRYLNDLRQDLGEITSEEQKVIQDSINVKIQDLRNRLKNNTKSSAFCLSIITLLEGGPRPFLFN